MPKAPPYIPFWIGDYITGSQHLKPEERYVYSELIFAEWYLGGRLPKDIRALRRLARAEAWSLQRFRKMWAGVQAEERPAYEPKFLEDDKGFYNERLEAELGAATGSWRKLSENGKKGALRRWGCPVCRSNGNAMDPGTLTGRETKCSRCGAAL